MSDEGYLIGKVFFFITFATFVHYLFVAIFIVAACCGYSVMCGHLPQLSQSVYECTNWICVRQQKDWLTCRWKVRHPRNPFHEPLLACVRVCVYVARTRYRTTTKKKCENRRESNFLSVILLCGRTKSKNVLLPIKRRSIDVNWIHSHKMWSFHWPLEWFALIANGEETCETNLRV